MPSSHDSQVSLLLFSLGVEFIIPTISDRVPRKALVISGCLLFGLAYFWSSLTPWLNPSFVESANGVATSFWTWFELAIVLLLMLVFAASVPFWNYATLPRLYAEDRELLVKALDAKGRTPPLKVQIIYANRKRCRDFAEEISGILLDAGWIQPQPPSANAFGARMPRAPLTLRSSMVETGSNARLKLIVTFRKFGWNVADQEDAKLRKYDYCFFYINGW